MVEILPDRIIRVPTRFNPYHRAHQDRLPMDHPALQKIRKPFFKALIVVFLMLQVVFFALFCYMFGSLVNQRGYVNGMKIEFVDYDGGIIGQSFRTAYQNLQAPSFPTLVEVPPPIVRPDVTYFTDQVCQLQYWASIWIEPGASDRLSAALAGGDAAANYNPFNVVSYVWNEARYPTIADPLIQAPITALIGAARTAYTRANGTGALQSINTADAAAIEAYSNPWQARQFNIMPTTQGARAVYNTLAIIIIIIQQFFYLAALNGIYEGFKVYDKLHPHRLIAFRTVISLLFCCVGAIAVTGAIWIFKGGWDVNGTQYALTWLVLWLFAHVNFLILDAMTVWIEAKFVPFFLATWLVINTSSILLPFDLVPGFFHWGYALPAHSVYNAEIDIWSNGCYPELHIGLPVLFSWWVLGFTLSCIGIHRRSHYAVIRREESEAEFQNKLTEALAFEKKRDLEMKMEAAREKESGLEPAEGSDDEAGLQEKQRHDELEAELRKIETKSRLQITRTRSPPVHYGPSFPVPFSNIPADP